jgi:hypothetical protein
MGLACVIPFLELHQDIVGKQSQRITQRMLGAQLLARRPNSFVTYCLFLVPCLGDPHCW